MEAAGEEDAAGAVALADVMEAAEADGGLVVVTAAAAVDGGLAAAMEDEVVGEDAAHLRLPAKRPPSTIKS